MGREEILAAGDVEPVAAPRGTYAACARDGQIALRLDGRLDELRLRYAPFVALGGVVLFVVYLKFRF